MLDRTKLLTDLQALLRKLEADLLERSDSSNVPEVGETLRSDYKQAKEAERTAQSYEEWRADAITQMASAWVLSGVFVRFLEDNQLIEPPAIAGLGERLQRARDEHELYFRQYPQDSDREYWLMVFDRLAKLPGAREIFGANNRLRELPNWLSGDAAGELLRFFQRVEPETGRLVHDFTDERGDTRFLGDLYQDLSEAARKKYALLQTPEFVESFILDRTLDPAIDEFQLEFQRQEFRMIDPACGSGHFLLGSFNRLLNRWLRQEPGTNVRELVQRSLNSIHGVDINPYAVAIARFRLLLVAMKASGIRQLRDAPAFEIKVVCGDSLLHGEGTQLAFEGMSSKVHYYKSEEVAELNRILIRGYYHAVVANPPYITPKDRALNTLYRQRFKTCHMKYSLAVPFMERIFQLAVDRGFTGQITANSFMKREFGKKLIEEFFPKVDLTHVIDTSGAYIPGHGTPTVILFGRNRKSIASTIRTVMGIKGEPSTPGNPAQGKVWLAILNQVDQSGSQSDFLSVADSLREAFYMHPWSIGGGGAADLKERLDQLAFYNLDKITSAIGITAVTGEDELFMQPAKALQRQNIEHTRLLVEGDTIRDWQIESPNSSIWLYDSDFRLFPPNTLVNTCRLFWQFRAAIYWRKRFGTPLVERGLTWYEWQELYRAKLQISFSITFAEVATHNHFVFDRGGKVFKQTAPVIKLPTNSTEDDHLALLGLLNSSTACFWMKQVCHQKQMMGGDGIRIQSKAKVPYAFNGTQVGRLPIPEVWFQGNLRERLLNLTQQVDQLSQEWSSLNTTAAINNGVVTANAIRERWAIAQEQRKKIRSQQVLIQEEIDFTIYRMFDLVSDQLLSNRTDWSGVPVSEGDRPFCIVDGSNEEGFSVPTIIPENWADDIVQLWHKRIKEIQDNSNLRLIESSMYKRRWIGRQGLFNHLRTDNELNDAVKEWLLDRLETYFDFDGRMNDDKPNNKIDISLISIAQLADIARRDPDFLQIGELYRNDSAFDVQKLVTELVEAESVPLLPILRYKPTGLRKRAEWEYTWKLQRLEDTIDARTKLPKEHPDYLPESSVKNIKQEELGDIPVPPKYTSSDFQKSHYWRLRGKLDVPKERWINFPYCNAEDGTMTIAWAGYNHLQLTQAISTYFIHVKEDIGGRDDSRLLPLLASLIELLPWLKQWHNDIDSTYNLKMGEYFEAFIQDEAREMSKTIDEVRTWQPPIKTGRRRT